MGSITTTGRVTAYSVGVGILEAITPGPDGALWFTYLSTGPETFVNMIGRITTAGAVTLRTDTHIHVQNADIAAGPDGAVWFTVNHTNSIGRVTTPG